MENEYSNIPDLHELIATHMKSITKTLLQAKQPKLCLFPLLAFQEAVQRHIALDESVFLGLLDGDTMKDLRIEHEEIKIRLGTIIKKAETAAYGALTHERIRQSALDIR